MRARLAWIAGAFCVASVLAAAALVPPGPSTLAACHGNGGSGSGKGQGYTHSGCGGSNAQGGSTTAP